MNLDLNVYSFNVLKWLLLLLRHNKKKILKYHIPKINDKYSLFFMLFFLSLFDVF